VAAMSDEHPMLRWAKANEMSVGRLADAVGISDAHLRNIFAGRKEASLGLAKRLSEVSGGTIPMDAFLRPVADEERA
jgi:plasmid maintenance system antidote protein VapI